MAKPIVICLMGPTASGKTPLAVELVQQLPLEIISVDSAMVYKSMDIGTAKPDAHTLKLAPHRLIDIRDPADCYSAGDFRRDALLAIDAILAQNKTPFLVGGTMLYFRVLQQGLADLPQANAELRSELQSRAKQAGWEALHAELSQVDAPAAAKIKPRDSQRIQRALEVYMLTGKTISAWQTEATSPLSHYHLIHLALMPTDRTVLHKRIQLRFHQMLAAGLMAEVEQLYTRGDLTADLPALRSVGYQEAWRYLAGEYSYTMMCEKAIASTRQLAKRQMTWLRSWQNITLLNSDLSTEILTAQVKEQLRFLL